MKYNVGDKVLIKSIDWYNENKDKKGNVYFKGGEIKPCFSHCMSIYCGQIMTISDDIGQLYDMIEDDGRFCWVDEMIEGLVEEETKPKFKVGDIVKWYNHTCNITSIGTDENTYIYLIKHDDYREDKTFAKWVHESELTFEDDEETKPLTYEETVEIIQAMQGIGDSWECPQGYIFKDENGNIINATKIVLEKKKKEYPKTYEECAEIIAELTGSDCNPKGCMGYMSVQLTALQKLLICRDAYWKIAGDEMGLNGPWKPDWTANDNHFYTIHTFNGKIECSATAHRNAVLIFPTEEIRDAFYENFKELIEICKELL